MSFFLGAGAVAAAFYFFNKNASNDVEQRSYTTARRSEGRNIRKVIRVSHGDVASALSAPSPKIVVFSATWCGHCKQLSPQLTKAKRRIATPIYKVNMSKAPEKLMKKLRLKGFPTIYGYSANGKKREYNGERTADLIVKFAETLN